MAKSPFKLKSGNKPGFKNMGSSPAKQGKGPKVNPKDVPTQMEPDTIPPKKSDSIPELDKGTGSWKDNFPKDIQDKIDKWNKDKSKDKNPWKREPDRLPLNKDKNPWDYASPAKQRLKKGGEAQDEDKIFNKKGEHVGDYVNDKKVMKYWYKINNKPVTKAQYMKYQNKPGGEEKGKQTNDPNVSLARQSANKRK